MNTTGPREWSATFARRGDSDVVAAGRPDAARELLGPFFGGRRLAGRGALALALVRLEVGLRLPLAIGPP